METFGWNNTVPHSNAYSIFIDIYLIAGSNFGSATQDIVNQWGSLSCDTPMKNLSPG